MFSISRSSLLLQLLFYLSPHLYSTVYHWCWARYVRYNGGVGKEQLSWLEGELHEASLSRQRVIGFGHVPIHPGDSLDHVLLWNYEDVRFRTVSNRSTETHWCFPSIEIVPSDRPEWIVRSIEIFRRSTFGTGAPSGREQWSTI